MNNATTESRGGDTYSSVAKSSALDRWVAELLLKSVGRPEIAAQLWDGTRIAACDTANLVRFHDRGALYRVLYKPSLTFGDLYVAGRIGVEPDLVSVLEEIYAGLTTRDYASGVVGKLLARLESHAPRANSEQSSKHNIHSHYDLGNSFYELWLDEGYNQYTCAYFPEPGMTLEQAQLAKMDLVCRKLQLRPGERVVETGGGWGGLARYMAKHYDVQVRSYNISTEQVAFAREQAAAEGLQDKVEYIEDDYRNVEGTYDVFVSVGMLEHVGSPNYPVLGALIDRCLTPQGRGLIHSIGQLDPRSINPWIEKNIFPGGEIPSLGQMTAIFEPERLMVMDVENLRPHYAETLRHWLERFERNSSTIAEMFDESFVRAWRLYLCGSIAGFTRGNLQLYQVLFQRHGDLVFPRTRAHLYE